MFDTEMYLRRIGYSGSLEPSQETLRELHKRHLIAVPFDTRSCISGRFPDVEKAFESIVLGRCGGTCLELNILFRKLLDSVGFETLAIEASSWQESEFFSGSNLFHLASGVLLDGEPWLVDVGFSAQSFLYPLRLTAGVQEQYGCQFRIVQKNGSYALHRKNRSDGWKVLYKFEFRHRDFEKEGFPAAALAQEEQAAVGQTVVLSRALENGHLQLIGKRCLEVEDGYERVRVLVNPGEYEEEVNRVMKFCH